MTLRSKVSLPKNIQADHRYPVIYLLHGMGSDEEDIFSLFEELKENYILIAIRGPIQQGNGFAYFNILRIGYPEIGSFEAVLIQLKDTMLELQKHYPIDHDCQFVAGFSQGAILSMSMAIRYGVFFKGIAALHGYVPQHVSSEKIADLETVHVFIGHGERDEMFSMAVGKANEAFFKDRTPEVTFKTYPNGHWVSQFEKSDVIRWFEHFTKDLTSSKHNVGYNV
jgi:phospholipase/carboxylesterase